MAKSDQHIVPYDKNYPEYLKQYLFEINKAIEQKKHHDYRRALLLDYLRKSYGVEVNEVEIEKNVKAGNVRGNIDALYKYLIFEVKTNIEAERPAGFLELKKYFRSQVKPEEYLAILTDGLRFELYQFEDDQLVPISEYTLNKEDILGSYRYFDNLIFASKKITPKSEDITTRFGPDSAIFNKSRKILKELLKEVRNESSVIVKLKEWNSLLARVYGDEIGDEILFLKHTYLAMFSRLLVLNALFPNTNPTRSVYKGLLTGAFFAKKNLPNVAEPDFFSWAMNTSVLDDFIGLLSKIDSYLGVYKLDNINEDILKEIYEHMVDTESRHSLGEYYTPDWIADLALSTINYKRGRILDPACGSGTFLLAVIRMFKRLGLDGQKLVNTVFDSIIGLDVHPLAVMMSKANILLGLAPQLRKTRRQVYLPVYMADTLLVTEDKTARSISINVTEDTAFHLPFDTLSRNVNADEMIDRLASLSEKAALGTQKELSAWKAFSLKWFEGATEHESFLWKQNFTLFTSLIRENRNSIWAFILKNAYRPAFIRRDKVDYIVGNPPWLAYRYIKDKDYKSKVKKMTIHYGLLKSKDVKLFTQLDTSTLFFVYSESQFLKKNGKIAFVLPKTTMLPAKQHICFQQRGITELHDFTNVTPLFNVRAVLVIRDKAHLKTSNIPKYEYLGRLPFKNMNLKAAKKHLEIQKSIHSFPSTSIESKYYYNRFLQGATIVPRSFWFVQQDKNAARHKKIPYLETSSETLKESKKPWQIKLQGRIEENLLFETVLAKGLVPFGISRTETIFLPVLKSKSSFHLANSNVLLEQGYENSADWMEKAESLWGKHRQSDDRDLIQWLNYNQKLTKQDIQAPFVILYNSSGTNLAAAVYESKRNKNKLFRTSGFIVESVTYYFYPNTKAEGLYLVTVLNSTIVNEAIKALQPEGLFGERHIHRRPFEACPIPKFDSKKEVHKKLAKMGRKCTGIVSGYLEELKGPIGRNRTEIRRVLSSELQEIDKLVDQLFKEAKPEDTPTTTSSTGSHNRDLFSL